MTSEAPEVAPEVPTADEDVQQDAPRPSTTQRKRPKLDLTLDSKERKRGKTMFGLLVGTLNKAKIEDKERNASDAAKKRHMIEQKLQRKLKKETDSMRRAEDAKKDKLTANRKEEDLQVKDSIAKLRRRRLPQLANFLCTSDDIPDGDGSPTPTSDPLALPKRSHPPPIYWMPTKLLPSQEAFIARRKTEVEEAITAEWSAFKEEREKGISEISELRQKVIDFHKSKNADADADADAGGEAMDEDGDDGVRPSVSAPPPPEKTKEDNDASMDVDEPPASANEKEKEDVPRVVRKLGEIEADDEDAVEY